MRVSVNLSNYSLAGGPERLAAGLVELVAVADEIGVDTVWVPDHLLQADPSAGDDQDMLEAYTTLGFLACASSRVRLGTMVTAVTFRPAALLVKAVGTVDVLSGGRAWLGVGAGYLGAEADAMGLPLPPVPERFERLEDLLQLAAQMWRGDPGPFQGNHVRAQGPVNQPTPMTRPHPPILIGGSGERRTLRLVAEYADAANLFDLPDGGATLRRKLAVLDGHCRDVGREPRSVHRTLSTRQGPGQTAAEFIDHCREVSAMGVDHVILHSGPAWTPDAVRGLAPIIETLAG